MEEQNAAIRERTQTELNHVFQDDEWELLVAMASSLFKEKQLAHFGGASSSRLTPPQASQFTIPNDVPLVTLWQPDAPNLLNLEVYAGNVLATYVPKKETQWTYPIGMTADEKKNKQALEFWAASAAHIDSDKTVAYNTSSKDPGVVLEAVGNYVVFEPVCSFLHQMLAIMRASGDQRAGVIRIPWHLALLMPNVIELLKHSKGMYALQMQLRYKEIFPEWTSAQLQEVKTFMAISLAKQDFWDNFSEWVVSIINEKSFRTLIQNLETEEKTWVKLFEENVVRISRAPDEPWEVDGLLIQKKLSLLARGRQTAFAYMRKKQRTNGKPIHLPDDYMQRDNERALKQAELLHILTLQAAEAFDIYLNLPQFRPETSKMSSEEKMEFLDSLRETLPFCVNSIKTLVQTLINQACVPLPPGRRASWPAGRLPSWKQVDDSNDNRPVVPKAPGAKRALPGGLAVPWSSSTQLALPGGSAAPQAPEAQLAVSGSQAVSQASEAQIVPKNPYGENLAPVKFIDDTQLDEENKVLLGEWFDRSQSESIGAGEQAHVDIGVCGWPVNLHMWVGLITVGQIVVNIAIRPDRRNAGLIKNVGKACKVLLCTTVLAFALRDRLLPSSLASQYEFTFRRSDKVLRQIQNAQIKANECLTIYRDWLPMLWIYALSIMTFIYQLRDRGEIATSSAASRIKNVPSSFSLSAASSSSSTRRNSDTGSIFGQTNPSEVTAVYSQEENLVSLQRAILSALRRAVLDEGDPPSSTELHDKSLNERPWDPQTWVALTTALKRAFDAQEATSAI